MCAEISASVRMRNCDLSTRGSGLGGCTSCRRVCVIKRCSSRNGFNGDIRNEPRFGRVLTSMRDNGSGISCILMFGLSQFKEGTTSILSSLRGVRSCKIGLVYMRSKVSDSGSMKGLVVSILSTITRVRHRGVLIRAVRNHERGTERNE